MAQLSEVAELDLGPTLDEVEKAIKMLKPGKAPGSDGIPPHELLKLDVPSLKSEIHSLLVACWHAGHITGAKGCEADHPVQKQRLQARL